MSDEMRIQPFEVQFRRIQLEYDRSGTVFGIPSALFHTPAADAPYQVPDLFGRRLAAPIGPSAGPHTQLSQNIVSAWLCGGRFIELKTVQVRDDLIIARPCIDMTDEGYNVEWSQELRLEHSAHEYIVAWALVHLLPRLLGWDRDEAARPWLPGVIFDMSVGYDLAGIRHPRMTRFMDTLADASEPVGRIRETIHRSFPEYADIDIPTHIVSSATLSTMHGCPPNEVERIARYLLDDRGLHTVVKLNPTLLGRERVRDILGSRLGFAEIDVPDAVFDHDLSYRQAVDLVRSLQATAARRHLTAGVKVSNTLAVRNHAGRLPGHEMYLSGRALYPVTMALFETLMEEFDGHLHVSYSAGADAVNVATILSCGALPVTGCSDLLKPGGYGRLAHWLDQIAASMRAQGSASLADLARSRRANLRAAAADALVAPRYRKQAHPLGLPKVASALPRWDCVAAPCVEACAVEQDVPGYAWWIARGDTDRALATIMARNPLPGVTGHVCTRLCQTRCTRNDYEESVAIRALKRFADAHGRADWPARRLPGSDRRVAIIGAGPSGLAAAAVLALNGVAVTIYEARDTPGGMMRMVPPFRLPSEVIDRDIERVLALGVTLHLASPVTVPPERLLQDGFDAVYLASGFQRDAPLRVPGANGACVIPALRLLERARRGEAAGLGSRVVVIGGGDTAMDAARVAHRLTAHPVTILYRRTRHEMPASAEEIEGALAEGTTIEELVTPVEVLRVGGAVVGVRSVRNRLGERGPDGRRSPEPLPGTEFDIPCDTVVVAIGQQPDLAFLDGSRVARHAGGGVLAEEATGSAGVAGVYAGGDVVVEPASIIAACADGRRAAEAMCARLGLATEPAPSPVTVLTEDDVIALQKARTRRTPPVRPDAPTPRAPFDLIESTYSEAQARQEALRCLQCATFCDKCVEVCPNRANHAFRTTARTWMVPVLGVVDGTLREVAREPFIISQARQIVHVEDFCNECDNCQTFCVHHGRPYADKPRIFLDAATFSATSDNAFHIAGQTIRRRDGGRESRLRAVALGWQYDDHRVHATMTPDWEVIRLALESPFSGTLSLRHAVEMAVLLEGLSSGLPFLCVPTPPPGA